MGTAAGPVFPWYSVVRGEDIQQGDIFDSCPVFSPGTVDLDNPAERAFFNWDERDVVIITQSCDLVKDQKKTLDHILLCAVWPRSSFTAGHLSTLKGLEDVRRGNLPAFHMIGACSEPGFETDVRIIEFQRVYSLPMDYVRQRAATAKHLRLLPPYREQLSQAFARYFMRVGLPSDIPPFR